VAGEVVGNHDVAGCQCRHKALADPGGEAVAVDRPVENEAGDDAVVAQPCEEGQGLPVAVRDVCCEPLAPRSPTAGPGHVGLDPRFIQEYQALRVKAMLMRFPPGPEPRHLRTQLLARAGCSQSGSDWLQPKTNRFQEYCVLLSMG